MVAVRSEARRLGWNVRSASWLTVQCAALGFLFCHILYAFTRLDLPWDAWWRMLFHIGYGNVWFGGFFASWAWCRFYAKRHNIPGFQMDDVAAFAVLLANPTGRIGCFFNGCCFGTPTNLPWGVELLTKDFGLARLHPVPLYEMFYQYTLFAILWNMRKKNTYNGQTGVRYLIFMPLGRFLLEFVRGDSIRGFVYGWMSTSQFIALGIIAIGISIHLYLKRAANHSLR